MRRRPSPLIIAQSFVVLALAGLPSGAYAQSGGGDSASLAAGQALYDQATKAMDAGKYAVACPKLEEVVRLAPQGVGARFDLARCYEGEHRLASAYTSYVQAETMAEAAKRIELQQRAHAGAAALKPKLAMLTIVVADGVRSLGGLEIRRDGAPVGSVQWGVAIPVDNGRHVVAATAAGKRTWEKTIVVAADGASETVTIDPMVDAPVEAAPAAAGTQPAPPAAPETPTAPASGGEGQHPSVAPWVIGGVGIAGLAVGGILAGMVAADKATTENPANCEQKAPFHCTATGLSAANQGRTLGPVSTVGFIVGGVGVGVAAVWLIARGGSGKSAAPVASVGMGPVVTASGAGWRLQGSW